MRVTLMTWASTWSARIQAFHALSAVGAFVDRLSTDGHSGFAPPTCGQASSSDDVESGSDEARQQPNQRRQELCLKRTRGSARMNFWKQGTAERIRMHSSARSHCCAHVGAEAAEERMPGRLCDAISRALRPSCGDATGVGHCEPNSARSASGGGF